AVAAATGAAAGGAGGDFGAFDVEALSRAFLVSVAPELEEGGWLLARSLGEKLRRAHGDLPEGLRLDDIALSFRPPPDPAGGSLFDELVRSARSVPTFRTDQDVTGPAPVSGAPADGARSAASATGSTSDGRPAERSPAPREAVSRPPGPDDRPGRPAGVPVRQLVAQMPAGVPTGEQIGLQVRVVGAGYDGPVTAAAPLLRAMPVRAGGTQVTIVVHAESGLVADGPLLRTVLVPERGDSDPVLFAFRAVARGLHRVDVKAYAGGTFLAELRAEVSVDERARRIDAPAQQAAIGSLAAVPGEVTLQVQADDAGHYIFQVLSDRTQFSPVTVTSRTGPAGPAVEQVLGALNRIARGTDYSGRNAREWLRQSGVNLWSQLVPAAVKEQFWQVRDVMSSFTIATGHDIVPWELLHPLRPGQDDGFLIEQVPVVRRVFDQARSSRIGLGRARYVVPPESPADALAEVAAVAARLGGAAGGVIDELAELLALVDRGGFGLAHFACHNNFRADAGGSSIRLRDGAFLPVMLSAATVNRSLAGSRPLVFINACRSAGEAPQYTRMMGWAKQFMAAGAGAFVGTLWDIRSRSAAAFADGFYQRLADGRTLGEAAHQTRLASAHDLGDPTWLAYSVYGDPAATAHAPGAD
ncbi:CHAT domain-containing protein, partial [Actinoplanes sp. NPDC051411]|uniref:CHAT domain-containing protein n=1 Tax=Actinoplanes sp. NPDC051411 TaxID=3155522 RepID=UPI003445B3A2